MINFNKQIYFYSITADKIIVPIFDVSLLDDFTHINESFLDNWKDFIKQLNIEFIENIKQGKDFSFLKKSLKNKGYNIEEKEKATIKVIGNLNGTIIYNFPDIHNATEKQIIKFIKYTKISLNDLKLRKDKEIVNTLNLNCYNLVFLNVDKKYKLYDLIKSQENIREEIWLALIIWWNYHLNDNSPEELIFSMISKCNKEIYYCDNFIRIYSSAKDRNEIDLLNWCQENLNKIVWDEDCLSDLETRHLFNCKNNFTNISIYKKEIDRREYKQPEIWKIKN